MEEQLRGWQRKAAELALKKKNYGKDTNAYKWYTGQIDPAWAKEVWESGASFPQTIPKKAIVGEGKGTPMLPPAHSRKGASLHGEVVPLPPSRSDVACGTRRDASTANVLRERREPNPGSSVPKLTATARLS